MPSSEWFRTYTRYNLLEFIILLISLTVYNVCRVHVTFLNLWVTNRNMYNISLDLCSCSFLCQFLSLCVFCIINIVGISLKNSYCIIAAFQDHKYECERGV